MEKDDEVKGSGNSYHTLFRKYDPRLGRWLSLDPKGHLFPDQSPYAGMDNNPVVKNDQNGDCTICDQLESFGITFDRGLLGGDFLHMDGYTQRSVSGSPQYSPGALVKAIKDPFGVRGVQSISEQTVSSSVTLLKKMDAVLIKKTTVTTSVEFFGASVESVTETTKTESIVLGISETRHSAYELDYQIPLVDKIQTSTSTKKIKLSDASAGLQKFAEETQAETERKYENLGSAVENAERMKQIESNFENATITEPEPNPSAQGPN